MRLSAACLALGLSLAAACRWATPPPLPEGNVEPQVAEAVAPRIVLGAGDRISIQVFLHPENSTGPEGVRIDPEGRLDLPLLGPTQLAGLTPDDARAKIEQELGHYIRDPKVTFNLVDVASRQFYVFGEMERPGVYPLVRPLTALQALSYAGGFRPGADRGKVALLRGKGDHLEVYFFDGATPGPDGMVAVQQDDFLFVRLSGAGTFRDQLLPIMQTLVLPIGAIASLIVIADRLND